MNHKEFIKNPEYHNWVKGWLALRYLQYGLCDFVKEVAKRQHEEIKTNIELTPEKICRTCQITSLKPHPCNPGPRPGKYVCPEGKQNCTCTREEYKECPNKICDRMRKAIIESHEFRDPTWTNIDITRCQNSPWEIQRCFLKGPGYDTKMSADDTDAAGLLMLISHNTYFRNCMLRPTSLFKKIRDWRGSVISHSNMELEEEQLKSVIKDIKTVLQDEKELNSMECAKQALRNVEELENERFIITTEHETDAFRDSIASIQMKVQELDSRLQDVEKDKEERISSVQKEESDLRERVDNHDACLQLLNARVAELERIRNEKERLIRLEKEQQAHLKEIEDRQGEEITHRVPTDRDLSEIAQHIGNNWEFVGARLKIPAPKIDQIKLDNPTTDMRIYKLLFLWRNSEPYSNTLDKLLAVLQDLTGSVTINLEKIRDIANRRPENS